MRGTPRRTAIVDSEDDRLAFEVFPDGDGGDFLPPTPQDLEAAEHPTMAAAWEHGEAALVRAGRTPNDVTRGTVDDWMREMAASPGDFQEDADDQ